MLFYANGREIRVGDRVVGIGTYDGMRIQGLRGRVVHTNTYTADVVFDDWHLGHSFLRGGTFYHRGDSGWACAPEYLKYDDGTVDASLPDGTAICDYCGQPFKKDERVFGARLYHDMCVCDACAERELRENQSYHFAKGLRYMVDPDKITLGAEIEIDDPSDAGDRESTIEGVHAEAKRYNTSVIMSHEHDGSLDNNGFESITAPLTIDEWKKESTHAQIKALLDGARFNDFDLSADGMEYSHAGLHVHIGRKSLCGNDRAVSDAVGLLMGWAVTKLWNEGFDRLSRRNNLEYTHLYNAHGELRSLKSTFATDDRYYCVNITNAKTIELRIFKGARNLDDVLVAVDFTYMLAKWATKKINAYCKRGTYDAKEKIFNNATEYAERLTWDALVKFSKFPEVTIPYMRKYGINI